MIPDRMRPAALVDQKNGENLNHQKNKVLPDLTLKNVNISDNSDKDSKNNASRPKHKFGEFILKDENDKNHYWGIFSGVPHFNSKVMLLELSYHLEIQ